MAAFLGRCLLISGAVFAALAVLVGYLDQERVQEPVTVNWEGKFAFNYSADDLRSPITESEIVHAVLQAGALRRRIKVIGSGHSWSDMAVPTQGEADERPPLVLSLHHYNRVLAVDADALAVTVQSGIRLRELAKALDAHDPPLALSNMPSIDEQTIGGVLATATHGSGPSWPNLATLVASLRLVLANGTVLELARDAPADTEVHRLFHATVVGLGAFGVVSEVTLRVEPTFDVAVEQRPVLDQHLFGNWTALSHGADYVKFWYVPLTGYSVVFSANRTRSLPRHEPIPRPVGVLFASVVKSLQDLASYVPSLTLPINVLLRLVGFAPLRRVARWDRGLTIPFPVPVHAEIEYAVPAAEGPALLGFLWSLVHGEGLMLNHIAEVRFVAGDQLWLSPNHGRPESCHITLLLPRSRGQRFIDSVFRRFERYALKLGGRPHWGKSFWATRTHLQAAYPRFRDAVRVRCELDRQGMFENAYVARVFGKAAVVCPQYQAGGAEEVTMEGVEEAEATGAGEAAEATGAGEAEAEGGEQQATAHEEVAAHGEGGA